MNQSKKSAGLILLVLVAMLVLSLPRNGYSTGPVTDRDRLSTKDLEEIAKALNKANIIAEDNIQALKDLHKDLQNLRASTDEIDNYKSAMISRWIYSGIPEKKHYSDITYIRRFVLADPEQGENVGSVQMAESLAAQDAMPYTQRRLIKTTYNQETGDFSLILYVLEAIKGVPTIVVQPYPPKFYTRVFSVTVSGNLKTGRQGRDKFELIQQKVY